MIFNMLFKGDLDVASILFFSQHLFQLTTEHIKLSREIKIKRIKRC